MLMKENDVWGYIQVNNGEVVTTFHGTPVMVFDQRIGDAMERMEEQLKYDGEGRLCVHDGYDILGEFRGYTDKTAQEYVSMVMDAVIMAKDPQAAMLGFCVEQHKRVKKDPKLIPLESDVYGFMGYIAV